MGTTARAREVGALVGDEVRRRHGRALMELWPRARAQRGKGLGEREELTTSTAVRSAGPGMDGVDDGVSRTAPAIIGEEEEEALDGEALGSAWLP